MVCLPRIALLVIVTGTMSGCVALSFGGKHEHVSPTPCEACDSPRIESLEARVKLLEERLNAEQRPNGSLPPQLSPVAP